MPEIRLRTYEVTNVWQLPKVLFWITKEAFEEDLERKVVEELRKQRDELGRVPTFLGTVSFRWTEDLLNWYCHHTWRFRGFYSASPIAPAVKLLLGVIVAAVLTAFAALAIALALERAREIIIPIVEKIPPWGWGLLTVAVVLGAGALLVRAVRK